ncbi:hypothetical protein BLA29_008564, partial [Euroglyphus maynei]
VIGDAAHDGDIELFIIGNVNNNNSTTEQPSTEDQSSNIPIRIEPGTKNLILIRQLDKESVEGESGMTIGVRCRPKRLLLDSANRRVDRRISTSDEPINRIWTDDIIIPIRILVTDANDNKPEWQGNVPYSVNISEMSAPGSVVMRISAVDHDQLGPYSTIEYSVEPGPYSHLLRFASPLEGTLVLAGQLDYETLPEFSVSIVARDQGNPPNTATTKVNVQVIDVDDQNPRFEMDKYTATLAEGQVIQTPLTIKPKPIRAEDPDRAIRSPI